MKRYIWQKRLAETGYAVTNPRSQIKNSCLLFVKVKYKITDNSINVVPIPCGRQQPAPYLMRGQGINPRSTISDLFGLRHGKIGNEN